MRLKGLFLYNKNLKIFHKKNCAYGQILLLREEVILLFQQTRGQIDAKKIEIHTRQIFFRDVFMKNKKKDERKGLR